MKYPIVRKNGKLLWMKPKHYGKNIKNTEGYKVMFLGGGAFCIRHDSIKFYGKKAAYLEPVYGQKKR